MKAINEDMRQANEKLIHELASKVPDTIVDEWHIKPFYPLKNGKKVASFGDHRHYYYKDKKHEISESFHVGLDMGEYQNGLPIWSGSKLGGKGYSLPGGNKRDFIGNYWPVGI